MIPLVGNAVPGVPAAKGGNSVRYAGTVLAHRTRWNAGDGVPYGIGMVRGKLRGRTAVRPQTVEKPQASPQRGGGPA